jgi:glycosyltransferase involved in cell wall biosynthesis
VLIVHNRYRPDAPSGENKVVDQEPAALRARGHEVSLFERHSGDIASWPAIKKATLPARVMWSTRVRQELAARIKAFTPDVIHVPNTFPLLTPSVLRAGADAGVPIVATLHNYKLVCASGDFFRDGSVCHECQGGQRMPALVHGCYRGSRLLTLPVVVGARVHASAWAGLVRAFIYISQAQRDLIAPVGLPAERGFVKYNFAPAIESGPAARDAIVACVGRLDEAKGAPLMMRGWDAFRRRNPGSPLRLVIAGGGPLEDEVRQWSTGHPSVEMLGMLSREQVAELLQRARAALVPSAWEETFGLVAIEAMAAGTAPIAPAHGSFPELIPTAATGELFRPGDAGALADVMASVDADPAGWSTRGAAARQEYVSRFSDDVLFGRLMDVYRFAIENPAQQRPRVPMPS